MEESWVIVLTAAFSQHMARAAPENRSLLAAKPKQNKGLTWNPQPYVEPAQALNRS